MFYKKPVAITYLVKRLSAELDQIAMVMAMVTVSSNDLEEAAGMMETEQ